MPNWVYINLNMKDLCKKEELFSTRDDGTKRLDFNKIIPPPKTKEECIEKYGEKYLDSVDEKGNSTHHLMHTDGDDWFNWYDWHCHFWGTKWNACDCKIEDDDTVTFETAWSVPEPILLKLSEMFPEEEINVSISYEMEDYYEDLTLKHGDIIKEEKTQIEGFWQDNPGEEA